MWGKSRIAPTIERLFQIPNKRGEIVPFTLNNVQRDFDERSTLRTDVLKFRQGGMTSLVMAGFLVECMSRFTRAVMIAHDKPHTEKLLQRCHLFLKLLRGPKPVLSRANDEEILFPKTNSSFYIGTAGSKQFGRSDTITHLHCSEFAFWPDPRKLIAGLFQAVPHDSGVVIKECTANGYGTYHHRQFMKAWLGKSRFTGLFYPWHIFEEYRSATALQGPLNEEEQKLVKDFNLTPAQLQWRREKMEEFEGDEELFKQEYPLTVEEAFLVSGGSLFPNVRNLETKEWRRIFGEVVGTLHRLEGHPKPGHHYVAGVDVSGGTGNDYSTIEILCHETMEEVLSYRINTLDPPKFAGLAAQLLQPYNLPYLVPEQNQHGISFISCIKDLEPYTTNRYRIYVTKAPNKAAPTYGFKTTGQTKYPLIGNLIRMLPELTLYSDELVDELHGFGEDDKTGKLTNVEGTNDDRVIALALACEGVRRERLRHGPFAVEEAEQITKPKGFIITLDNILQSLRPQQNTWFANQTSEVDHVKRVGALT